MNKQRTFRFGVIVWLNQSMTSGDLDGLLTVYEREYATAERGGLWMSPEYAAVLEEHIHMGDEAFPRAECTSHRYDGIDEDIILQWFQMRVANWPWKVECEVYHERTSRSNTLS